MSSAPHDTSKQGHHLPDDFPAPVRALAATSRLLAVIEGVGIGVSLATLVVLALWQSIARTLHMGIMPSVPPAPEWTNNVLRHAVFLIGFLGAMFATYTARHLRVDAVTRLAGVRARLALRIVGTAGALVVSAAIAYWGWVFHDGVMDEQGDDGQLFTASRGALVLVIGVASMMFHMFVQLCIDATYLATGREVPAWWISEATHGGEAQASAPEPPSTTDAPEAAL